MINSPVKSASSSTEGRGVAVAETMWRRSRIGEVITVGYGGMKCACGPADCRTII